MKPTPLAKPSPRRQERLSRALCATVAVLLAGLISINHASANEGDVPCISLPRPSIGVGGSAQRPMLARLGRVLAGLAEPSTLVYAAPGACNGPNLLRDADSRYSGTASYWLADGTERTCTIDEPGVVIDFAVMGNAIDKCPGFTEVPAGVTDFLGPVGTVNLIVPVSSTEVAISSEALYFVYGFGASGGVEPWTDESQLISRDVNSFVALYVSLAAGLPVSRMLGIDARTNGNSVALVAGSPNPNAAIGFTSGSVADAARDRVRTLAYQHRGQTCAYWPDSTPAAFDKRNVRDGHYWIWGAAHIFARTDNAGRILNDTSRTWIGWLTGDVPEPADVSVIDLIIEGGDIPQCAMTVRRDGDLSPPYSWAPPEPSPHFPSNRCSITRTPKSWARMRLMKASRSGCFHSSRMVSSISSQRSP